MSSGLEWCYPDDKPYSNHPTFDIERLIGWLQNFQVMTSTIKIQSIDKLPPIKGSALIIDKSMASTQFYNQLSALHDYSGTIIVCDRAIQALLSHEILPDYVLNVDASPLCFSFFDDPNVKKYMSEIRAVFPVTTNPLTVRLWHGERFFYTPVFGGLTRTLASQSKTMIMPTGGQVASAAYVLAVNLGAKEIGLFGITHSYDSMDETEYPLNPEFHSRVEGPYGICWQDPVYEFYNREFQEFVRIAKQTHKITTFNASKNGLLYSPDIEDVSLEEFVKRYGSQENV